MNAQQLQAAGYVQRGEDGVWTAKDAAAEPFAYSDGDVEGWIFNQLATVTDLSTGSTQLTQKIRDWPTLYHFSAQRADLLRPLAHRLRGAQVLEVGAGCGAITRYLGETAAHVLAVEGSPRRAGIARRRCRDLNNVEVLCANSMDLTPVGRFDVVTLIGVLEYSRKFVRAEDPVQAMLAHCRSMLKPGGLLLVAIENQLGLKYFAGAYEDHEGKAFYGVHGSYGKGEAVTFGRTQLQQQLWDAGFLGTRLFFPFPDYKLPTVVLSHEGALTQDPVVLNLAGLFQAQDQGAPYRRTFSEQAAWPQLMRNGLLPDLANSFLLVGRSAPFAADDDVLAHPGDLAYIYSTRRPRQFHKENVLRRQDDAVHVLRRRLYPQLAPQRGGLQQHVQDESAVLGPSLFTEFTEIVNRPGWSMAQVAAWAKPWVQMVEQLQQKEGSEQHAMPHVPGKYVDLAPQNLLRCAETGKLQAIDLEWDLGQPIPAHFVLFRGLMHSFALCNSVAAPAPGTPLHIASLVQQTLDAVAWPLNQDECLSLLDLESAVFGGTPQAFWQNHLRPRA